MSNSYDLDKIYRELELELIASMKRNLQRHLNEEKKEGFNWTQWQAEKIKSLRQYRDENKMIYFKHEPDSEQLLRKQYKESKNRVYRKLKKKGISSDNRDTFFDINSSKIDSLINATTNDLEDAKTACLRMMDDQYRKTVFKAQTAFQSGTMTLKQAVDCATHDFLARGINCIEFKGGRRVGIGSYSKMCIRTANTRAKLIAEGSSRNELGIHTVRVSRYGGCSETCQPWQGRIYIDDVYSGGTKEDGDYPLLSKAMAGGLFHPNCKHQLTTYIPGISDGGEYDTDEDETPPIQKEIDYYQRQEDKYTRLATGSLDEDNVKKYQDKGDEYRSIKLDILDEMDYMSNSFKPKLGDARIIGKTSLYQVKNSKFNMYVETIKDKQCVKTLEKELEEIKTKYPDIIMPSKIVIMNFDNLNEKAIAGYNKEYDIIVFNSKYKTIKSIKEYINKNKGYFSNDSIYAPLLHELGHKKYEDSIKDYAKVNNITTNKARKIIEDKISSYIGNVRKNDDKIIQKYISGYAYKEYRNKKYQEIYAECFASNKNNDIIRYILDIMG